MKSFIFIYTLLFLLLCSFNCQAETYQYSNGLRVEAKTYKQAATLCFKTLTNSKYPGEEKGMDIVDICVNPTKGKIN